MNMRMDGPLPATLIRELPTPELALALLRSLAAGEDVNANSMFRGADQAFRFNQEPDVAALLGRLSDAWAWLVAHGLIGPHPTQDPSSWSRITQEGQAAAVDEGTLSVLWAQDRLAGDLHLALAGRVRPIFNLGDFETAAFAAMKAVEVAVRRLGRFGNDLVGVDLMRQAFRPDGGPLADSSAHRGEQVAMMELFAGAIGTFKNPSSHRPVDFDDPIEAAEVVQTADLLLRLLDRVKRRLADAHSTAADG